MARSCLITLFIVFVSFLGAYITLCQTTNKTVLNPPKWIFGSWSNFAESNIQKFEAFTFTANEIQLLTGFSEKSKTFNFAEEFNGFDVTETIEPQLYRVTFIKETREYIYEFKICDDCVVPTDQKALTYSVTKNKKVSADIQNLQIRC